MGLISRVSSRTYRCKMQIILNHKTLSQVIDVSDDLTIGELFSLACLTFLDTDSPDDKSLELFHNSKVLDKSKSLANSGISNGGEIRLKSKSSQPKPQPSPKVSSSNKRPKIDILKTALDGLQDPGNSSSTSKASPLDFDFGSLATVQVDKTKTENTEKIEDLKLSKKEVSHQRQMFDFLMHPNSEGLKANLLQQNPEQFEALQKNDFNKFLESHRQELVYYKKREKDIFDMILNPDSKETKDFINKRKKFDSVQENFKLAMEHTPEVFGNVFMLYINCKVNGQETKAFVDSGAQKTIISSKWCTKCKLDNKIDERFSGMAKGVGFQKIAGRVHYAMLEIEGQFFTTSFDVLEGQDIDILIGLDFLKRHRASIDLSQNALLIPEGGIRTRFLNENELPSKDTEKIDEQGSSAIMQDDAFDENLKRLVEITGQ